MPDSNRPAQWSGRAASDEAAGDQHGALRDDVAEYYGSKVTTFGATPRGVDWNSAESQALRFEQLLRIIPSSAEDFTIVDYGCGYGALVEPITRRYSRFRYQGFDLSREMVEQATRLHAGDYRCSFTTIAADVQQADYVVASGVLNVKLAHSFEEWTSYFESTVRELARLAVRGFAFNALTAYSDRDRQRPDLYYADPLAWFDHCKRRYSRFVSLLHDYPLYEFTILVSRERDTTR